MTRAERFRQATVRWAVATVVLIGNGVACAATRPAVTLKIAGTPQVAWNWDDNCKDLVHVPDAPITAYRRIDGSVVVLSVSRLNIPLTGPSVGEIAVGACKPLLTSMHDGDPSHFADNEWLLDVIHLQKEMYLGFVHDEYHGAEHRISGCSSEHGKTLAKHCWYAATTSVVSTDGGFTFQRQPIARGLLSALPYRFDNSVLHAGLDAPKAIKNPNDGMIYVFLTSSAAWKDQQYGQCLFRGNDADVASWTVWNGKTFERSRRNPYEAGAKTQACTPVLPYNIWSVRYYTLKRQFVALGQLGARVIYLTSEDLTAWSQPEVLMPFKPHQVWRVGDPQPTLYYSLLDPESTSSAFDTLGAHPYLYYVRWRVESGKVKNNKRDIIRQRLEIID